MCEPTPLTGLQGLRQSRGVVIASFPLDRARPPRRARVWPRLRDILAVARLMLVQPARRSRLSRCCASSP